MNSKQFFLFCMLSGFSINAYPDVARIVNDTDNISKAEKVTKKFKGMHFDAETKSYVLDGKKYYFTSMPFSPDNVKTLDKAASDSYKENNEDFFMWTRKKSDESVFPEKGGKPDYIVSTGEILNLLPIGMRQRIEQMVESCGYDSHLYGDMIKIKIYDKSGKKSKKDVVDELNENIGSFRIFNIAESCVRTLKETENDAEMRINEREQRAAEQLKQAQEEKAAFLEDKLKKDVTENFVYGFLKAVFSENPYKVYSYYSEETIKKLAISDNTDLAHEKSKIIQRFKNNFSKDYSSLNLEKILEKKELKIDVYSKDNLKKFGKDFDGCDCALEMYTAGPDYIKLYRILSSGMEIVGTRYGLKKQKDGWKIITATKN